jgi:hypothetical protein
VDHDDDALRLERLARLGELLADVDSIAPALWPQAPSYAMSPPLTPQRLAQLELELGVRLPGEYRSFLLVLGSAGPGPDYGLAGPDQWAMPDELPEDTATVTTVDGRTFTAGTGPRPRLAGEPDPARPFPLTAAWRVDDPLPLYDGGHLYDGCLHLNDIGCGYSTFLVVTGPQRGTVWVDYSAGDGDIAPAGGFLDWYGRWLDEVATSLLVSAITDALDARSISPFDAQIHRWTECFERRAELGPPQARAELAVLRLYQARTEEWRGAQAFDLIEELSTNPALEDAVERLTRWADAPGVVAATADPPGSAAAETPLWRIRRLLARNPQCPPEILDALASDDRHEVRLAALAHPSCPPSTLDGHARATSGRWRSAPLECLLELDLVARHPATESSTVLNLVAELERTDEELASNALRTLAQRPDAPAVALEHLAGSRWPWVRSAVAGNPSTPVPVVATLAADEHPAVRSAAAGRIDAPHPLLGLLADDPAVTVRASVAANPGAPASALRRLGGDTTAAATVTYALLRNPATPPQVQAVLRLHPFVVVSDDPGPAEPEPSSLAELVAAGEVADPDYPHALLAAAIADPDVMVGYRAARSPWLDEPLLRALAAHPYAYARLLALDHPAPPADVVRALVEDPVPMVVCRAAARAEVPGEVATRLAAHPDEECRWGAALNPNIPVEVLVRLSGDEHVYVRRAALENPRTPLSEVERLIRDPELLVRRHAGIRNDLTDEMVRTLLADPEPDVVRAGRWYLARRALAI